MKLKTSNLFLVLYTILHTKSDGIMLFKVVNTHENLSSYKIYAWFIFNCENRIHVDIALGRMKSWRTTCSTQSRLLTYIIDVDKQENGFI